MQHIKDPIATPLGATGPTHPALPHAEAEGPQFTKLAASFYMCDLAGFSRRPFRNAFAPNRINTLYIKRINMYQHRINTVSTTWIVASIEPARVRTAYECRERAQRDGSATQ